MGLIDRRQALGLLAVAMGAGPAEAQAGRTQLVPFEASPFPYAGTIPDTGQPFLDVERDGRRGHTSPRGGVIWADRSYADRRVLLSVPARFDPGRPGTMVVYLHGNQATLERDVRGRQRVPRQVEASGLNAVLVAPQLAVDALDSSAGRFWESGYFAEFLAEAAGRLAELSGGRVSPGDVNRLRVVLVAYSGGYLPAAFALDRGGADDRIAGVLLLDALYAEPERFAAWVERRRRTTFFVSAYSASTRAENLRLQGFLDGRGVPWSRELPAALRSGSVAVYAVGGGVAHNDFVTRAWTADPLRDLLARIR